MSTLAYVRQSTSKQEESIEKQIACLLEWAMENGWVLNPEDIYQDTLSGADQNRPGLLQLIRACESGNVKRVLLYTVSRLARDTEISYRIEKLASSLGIEIWVYSYRRVLDFSRSSDRLTFGIDSLLSEMQRIEIARSVSWGMYHDAKIGKFDGGVRPYGYRRDPLSGILTIDPEESKIVRRIFTNATWKSLRETASDFNAEKIPSSWGGPWTPETIRKILYNRAYLGDVVYRKSFYEPYGDQDLKRKRVLRPPDKWILCVNAHPAIVSDEEWKAAHHALIKRRLNRCPAPCWHRLDPFLLRGAAWCKPCDHPMQCRMNGKYRWYDCSRRDCSNRYIAAANLEIVVFERLTELAKKQVSVNTILEEFNKTFKDQRINSPEALVDKIYDCRKRLDRLDQAAHRDGIIQDAEFYQERKDGILKEMENLERDRAASFAAQEYKESAQKKEQSLLTFLQSNGPLDDSLSDNRRSFLRQVLGKVLIGNRERDVQILLRTFVIPSTTAARTDPGDR